MVRRNAVLVQTGDYFDRGPDMRKLLDFLRALESSAAAAGGTVHILLGNHDAMNLLGEVRDVNRAAYDAFAGDDAEKRRQRAFRDYIAIGDARERLLGSRPEPYREKDRDKWLSEHPPGYIEYQAAMGADGEYGRWLRQRQAVLQIGGTIFPPRRHRSRGAAFVDRRDQPHAGERDPEVRCRPQVHGDHGLTLSFFSLKETVEAARVEAAGLRGGQVTAPDRHHIEMINTVLAMGTSPLLTTDGPLWYRGFDTWTEERGPPDDSGAAVALRCTTIRDRTFHPEDGPNLRPVRRPRVPDRYGDVERVQEPDAPPRSEIAGDRVTAIYSDSKDVLVEGTQPVPRAA